MTLLVTGSAGHLGRALATHSRQDFVDVNAPAAYHGEAFRDGRYPVAG